MTDQDQPVIKPGEGFFKVEASERVVFLPAGPTAQIIAQRFRAKKKRTRPYPAKLFRLKKNNLNIDIVGPAMGAPVAGMVLEQLIAGGAKKLIFLGLAGSFVPDLKIGDLLVVKEAISDEGTSKDYLPEKNPPIANEELLNKLCENLLRNKIKFKIGKVLTTDAFFRETASKLNFYQKQGAQAVEMELSALYTIARFRGIKMAGMVIISDEHFQEEWKAGFKSPKLLLSLLRAGKLAIEVLAQS